MAEGELKYFRENPGYKRILEGIYKKYRSLGRLGGTVTLRKLTDEEKGVLSNHLRRDYSRKKSASFSVKVFEESLKNTRFEHYSLEDILEGYFGIDLISKAEEEARYLEGRSKDFEVLLSKYRDEPAGKWLKGVLDGTVTGIRRVKTAYSRDRKGLIQSMEWVSEALNALGNRSEGGTFRLPVLASLITRDPHAFDGDTLAGNLLIDALCTIYSFSPPSNNQDVAEILYNGGILIDEISNFITIAGLRAVKGGKPHPVWDFAMAEGEMLQVPLANLVDIERITSPIDRIYVVENPAVFSALLDGCGGQEIPPLVCSYGQVKLAGLIVLDKLTREGTDIFYSGDFDPEGLLIANKLARRYGDSFHLWRYGTEEYRRVVSEQKISLKRLSMLDLIDYPGLQSVKEEMKALGRAGYQELLISGLLKDVDH